MRTLYLGIDPGITGGLVVLDHTGKLLNSTLMPTFAIGGKQTIDARGLADWIRISRFAGARNIDTPDETTVIACLESVSSRPGEGVVAAFSFGRSYGILLGIIASNGYRLVDVRPTAWSKLIRAGGLADRNARKLASATYASKQWPSLPLARKKDWALADAALIAEWARQQDHVTGRVD